MVKVVLGYTEVELIEAVPDLVLFDWIDTLSACLERSKPFRILTLKK